VEYTRTRQGGGEAKRGTKHFSAGTKVYAFPAQWGDGYEKIVVVGKHRGSRGLVTMVIRSDWVTNWRAKMVYDPKVLRRLQKDTSGSRKTHNWKKEREVKKFLKILQEHEASKRD
jgi:hypothetical protein